MEIELKPCPFCGSVDLDYSLMSRAARCRACGASGPDSMAGKIMAQLYWNCRNEAQGAVVQGRQALEDQNFDHSMNMDWRQRLRDK